MEKNASTVFLFLANLDKEKGIKIEFIWPILSHSYNITWK